MTDNIPSNERLRALLRRTQSYIYSGPPRNSDHDSESVLSAEIRAALDGLQSETLPAASFQDRVMLWMRNCFVRSDAMDPVHRSFRFTEEALELAQATGCSQGDTHRLVDYVYNRPVGEASQEGGGVMVTLAALLTSLGLNLNECGEGELERCIENTDRIRAKDLAKPQRSPLPGHAQKADVRPDDALKDSEQCLDPYCCLPRDHEGDHDDTPRDTGGDA